MTDMVTELADLAKLTRDEFVAMVRSRGDGIIREPRTYEPSNWEHSYFRDLATAQRNLLGAPAALGRLNQHRRELLLDTREREMRAMLAVGQPYEVRAPNWVPGQGGYFAPPMWMVEAFADIPRAKRVLARLAPNFLLPKGGQSVNVPILGGSPSEGVTALNEVVPMVSMADSAITCPVVTIAGMEDVPLALLEQSALGAPLDWVIFKALQSAYDEQLEEQLLYGTGVGQILGILNVPGATSITYTDASPTGNAMFPFLGQAFAAIGRKRKQPLEAWLMNSPRFGWLATQALPTTLLADRVGNFPTAGLLSRGVYLDEAIPTLASGQEPIIGCVPSDLMVLESDPITDIDFQSLSGAMQARISMRSYVAGVTARYPSGIAAVIGTGVLPAAGF
jgi:HK97 family phage major capsid protein